MVKNILIIGVVGKFTHLLIHEALTNSYNVTALLSDSEQLRLSHPDLEILKGDVYNYRDVKGAVAGQDAVIWALEDDKVSAFTTGTHNTILAMEEMHVRTLICLSSVGSGSSAEKMGPGFHLISRLKRRTALLVAKGEQEKMVLLSKLDSIVVQVGRLTDGGTPMKKLKVVTPGHIKWKFFNSPGKVSRTGVTQFIIAQLASDRFIGQTVMLFT